MPSAAGQETLGRDMQERVMTKNRMTPDVLARYLPYIHPMVEAPVPEGVSLGVPAEPANRRLAAMGIVDVTAAPFGADASGETDATAAIRQAVDFARDRQMVLFFPAGTYRISDTIECRQKLTVRGNGRLTAAARFPCVLVGSAVPGKRSVLLLAPRSEGFADPAERKIVVHFTNCNYGYDKGDFIHGPLRPQANINYNQVFADIDIVIGEGNGGAVGIRMQAAEGSTIQDVTIDATHGHTGMLGAAGSGGSHHNITIKGGRIGIDTHGYPPEFAVDRTGTQPTPTMAHVTLIGQTEAALLNKSRGPLVAVGWAIKTALTGPVIHLEKDYASSPYNSGLALIDSVISFDSGAEGGTVCNGGKSFYMRNVYVRHGGLVAPGVDANRDGWLRIDELAYPVQPRPFKGFTFTEPVCVDGVRSSQPLLRSTRDVSPPRSLCDEHIWPREFPSWQSPGVANVRDAPYNASGDGQTDDTAALQKAIDENETVFLPKGYYRVTDTLRLRPKTKLIGLAHHLSTIMARAPYGALASGTAPKPLVETADTAEADTVIAFLGIMVADEAPEDAVSALDGRLPYYALSWRCSGSSIVRSPQIARGHLFGFPAKRAPGMGKLTYDAPTVRISGNGGGKWYNFFIHGMSSETDDYRHILVDGTHRPLAFYHLHAQHADSFAQCEIRNSRNVTAYGVKTEYQTRFLLARNSSAIAIFGHGGNATAVRGSAHYVFEDCRDVTMTNMSDQFDLRRKAPVPMAYRKYPAEPFTEYSPIMAVEGGVTFAVPHTEHPILWRIGASEKGSSGPDRPLVGAIRWDAWTGGTITEQVERTLGPAKYHDRLPWFARVVDDNTVRIDGGPQDVMDREIEFAADAGLDYWAFLVYQQDSPMSCALGQFLASSKRDRMRFCVVLHSTLKVQEERWPEERDRVIGLLRQPDYVTVLGGRPLVYAFLGGGFPFERFAQLRQASSAAGLDPYYVFMGWNPAGDFRRMSKHGFDAVSAYAKGGNQPAFIDLARSVEVSYWQASADANVPCVPLVTTGWDKRPRIDHPVSWEKGHSYHTQNVFPSTATPEEIAGHLGRAISFVRRNSAVCEANAVVIYAWNEHDEGGWLSPTLGPDGAPDTARLDAVREVLSTQTDGKGQR